MTYMAYVSKDEYKKNKINNYYKNRYAQTQYAKKTKDKRLVDAKIDVIHRIYKNIQTRIYKSFKLYGIPFTMTYSELIGCDHETLEKHLQERFTDGMSYDNYGEWEVDHIFPISKFDFTKIEQIFSCFKYTNLQPLWKLDNKQKSNNL